MDDGEFLAELGKFDTLERRPVPIEQTPPARNVRDVEHTPWPRRPTFDDPEEPPAPSRSARHIALAVAGFLLMMCAGAATAALVFRDRITMLLR